MADSHSSDPTIPLGAGEELPYDQLDAYLQSEVPQLGDLKEIRRFPGGFSNLTYLLRTTTGEFVLRRPPRGANIRTAHDMSREYRILSALKPHYPLIPTPIHYADETAPLGVPFYIMERVNGTILRGTTELRTDLNWADLADALIRNLARLHQVSLADPALADLGRPEGYAKRQVTGWTERYFRAQTDDIPEMDELAEWMPDHLPTDDAAALIHNDYKYDNLIWDPGKPDKIRAVLDWEMATTGHPLMDLGTTLAYWAEATDPPMLLPFNPSWQPGNPTRAELAARYFDERSMPVPDLLFFYVAGLFKIAVIGQQIYKRHLSGNSTDARFGMLIHVVRAGAKMAVRALEKGQI